MRLKQLLLVGKSIAGARPDKSPYEMRRENRLPTFEGSPRFAHKKRGGEQNPPPLVQGELLVKTESLAGPLAESLVEPPVETAIEKRPAALPLENSMDVPNSIAHQTQAKATARVKRRHKWLDYIGRKLFGRSGRRSDLVQSELTLDNIRVLRNDLENSDLELVMKKKRVRKPGSEPARPGLPPATRPTRTSSWNELTARLFEIGQQ